MTTIARIRPRDIDLNSIVSLIIPRAQLNSPHRPGSGRSTVLGSRPVYTVDTIRRTVEGVAV
jgi:hypothetical protein